MKLRIKETLKMNVWPSYRQKLWQNLGHFFFKFMDYSKHHKAHACVGPNFESLPLRLKSLISLFLIITKAKGISIHGFVNIFDFFFFKLRSRDKFLLTEPRTKLIAGEKGFYAAAPRLWNSLPTSLLQKP